MLGLGAASLVFAIALLASGLNSTITATLAGQIVIEGFLQLPFAVIPLIWFVSDRRKIGALSISRTTAALS